MFSGRWAAAAKQSIGVNSASAISRLTVMLTARRILFDPSTHRSNRGKTSNVLPRKGNGPKTATHNHKRAAQFHAVA
jgi:hypothetical protein